MLNKEICIGNDLLFQIDLFSNGKNMVWVCERRLKSRFRGDGFALPDIQR